jgi:purine nucleosidase
MSIWDLQYGRRIRALIDTDAKNEADDQFATVHALLSPSLDMRGLIPAHFGMRRGPDSMEQSRQELDLLLRLLHMQDLIKVADGAPHALPDIQTPVDCAGARLIIDEAMKDDEAPLFVAFLGPLTDMASALLMDPNITERDITVIWIGGPPYEGVGVAYKPEFNLSNDIIAANIVFASALKLWQVPMSTYVMMATSFAELYEQISPCGELGHYLVQQLVDFNQEHPHEGRIAEFRSLGDSPAVALMLNPSAGSWTERPAPGFNYDCTYDYSKQYRPIRVYNTIDSRFVFADLIAKLRAYAGARNGAT